MSGLEGRNGVTRSNVDARVGDLKGAILRAYSPETPEFIRAKAIAKTKFGTRPWESGVLDEEELFPELDVLHEWLQYAIRESDLRKQHKLKTDHLYEQVEAKYQNLTENDIQTLVVKDKWIASVESAIGQEVERLTGRLVERVRVLEGRYENALPELTARVERFARKVKRHLEGMGQLLTGRTRLPAFGGEWELRRLGDLGTFNKGRGIARGDVRENGVRCVRYGELYTRYENYVAKPVSQDSTVHCGYGVADQEG